MYLAQTIDRTATAQTSLEAAYRDHCSHVYRWSVKFGLGSTRWAEDLTHDVFLKLLENPSVLETSSDNVRGWLYRVTANLAMSRIRRERSAMRKLPLLFFGNREHEPPAHENLEVRQEAQASLEALKDLPARERVVMSMKLLEGRSQQEISEALSMSKGYVSKLVARATRRLQAAGWEVDDAAS